MSNKVTLLMFAVTVLLVSSVVMAMPQANALTKGNTMKNISTASYGNSLVCGDHKCAPGEHTQWYNAVWQSQRTSSGKVVPDTHGEDVMDAIAKETGKQGYKWETPVNKQTPITGYK
jgi:hypothetical protein